MPCPVQPDCQPSRTSWSWLATGMAALAVEVSSGPKMKLACTWVTHLCTRAAAVAGSDASFSGTRVTLWPIRPPALLTMAAQAVAPSSSLMPSWANGPEVAAISQMVMGELADAAPAAARAAPGRYARDEKRAGRGPAEDLQPSQAGRKPSQRGIGVPGEKTRGSEPGIVHQSPLWLRSGL